MSLTYTYACPHCQGSNSLDESDLRPVQSQVLSTEWRCNYCSGWAQVFETVLVPLFQMFKMHSEPGYLELTAGCIPEGAWKTPTTNVIKILSSRGSIASDFERRINLFIDNRNTLMHRWVQKNGWPDDGDTDSFSAVTIFASGLEYEAKDLTRLLVGYVVKYANPEWASSNMVEYKRRMVEMFQRAHIDGV